MSLVNDDPRWVSSIIPHIAECICRGDANGYWTLGNFVIYGCLLWILGQWKDWILQDQEAGPVVELGRSLLSYTSTIANDGTTNNQSYLKQ